MKYLFVILAVLLVNTEDKIVSASCNSQQLNVSIVLCIDFYVECAKLCENSTSETETQSPCVYEDIEKIFEDIQDLIQELVKDIDCILQDLGSLEKLLDYILCLLKDITTSLDSTVQPLSKSISSILKQLIALLKKLLSYLEYQQTCKPSPQQSDLISLVCELIKELECLLDEIDQDFYDITKLLGEIICKLQNLLGSEGSKESDTQSNNTEEIEKLIEDLKNILNDTENTLGSLGDVLTDIVQAVITVADNLLGIKPDDTEESKNLIEAVEDLVESVVKGLWSGWNIKYYILTKIKYFAILF